MTTKTKPKRVTMSAAREQAIYDAVHQAITDLRIELRRGGRWKQLDSEEVDAAISKAGDRAGIAAIRAAGGEGK